MFQVGELVYYPMHGIGTVETIEEQSVLGEKAQYYTIRFRIGNMTAMVPVLTAESVGLRYLTDKAECDAAVEYLRNGTAPAESENWNQRYRDNMDKLKDGNIRLVAEVAKCLIEREKIKGLSTGERKMFVTARQVLSDELEVAGGISAEEIETLFDRG